MKSKPDNMKILRRMNYLSDQKGIMNRYLDEWDHWEEHLENTREFIIHCLLEGRPETVAVLGSGWLLDLPVEDLVKRCKLIYLVDVYHPPQVLHRTGKMENVRAITADITGGGIQGVYDFIRSYDGSRPGSILDIPFQAALPGIRADYVISLNILNQLDILLIDYMKKHIEIPGDDEMAFRERIQSQHLSLLPPKKSCLVTDAEERLLKSKDTLISTRGLIHCTLPRGRLNQEWIWEFDTRGEYNPGFLTEMLVRAIQI
jgi:hypothetical protein